jgi:murein DD-endopeptidase MepM/ murein hydrolase activator NlpD
VAEVRASSCGVTSERKSVPSSTSGLRLGWRLVALAALVLIASTGVGASSSSAAPADERRLQQARAKLDAVRDKIESTRDKRQEREAALAQAEARVAEVLEAVRAAQTAVRRQQERVQQARQRYQRLQAQAESHQQAMARRAAELYRQGTQVPMSAVLASDSVDEAMNRSTYIEFVQRADRAGFEEVEADQARLDAQQEVLQQEEAVLERRLAQKEEILAQARELRDERALRLADVEKKLDELQAHERHLESESRQLAAMARRANEQHAHHTGGGASQPSSSGGAGWQWPARGAVTSTYGMRWGRMHAGIDVAAAHGAAVVAARAGTVSDAGRVGGYGNMVLIAHGGGVTTAYAHLSSITVSPGQSVGAGQRLGGMGCTGSCTGTHVHFEVRVNGAPRNPQSYLP